MTAAAFNVIKAKIANLTSQRQTIANQVLSIDAHIAGLREAMDALEKNPAMTPAPKAKRPYKRRAPPAPPTEGTPAPITYATELKSSE